MWRGIIHGLQQLVYPAMCVVCQQALGDQRADFCAACQHALTHDPHRACPRCGSTIADQADVSEGCPRCREDHFYFESVLRLGPYEGLLRDVILRMKYRPGELLAECVGLCWADHHDQRFRSMGIDLVMPIPLHWWRRWKRGFNQSEYLSAAIARRLGVEHRPPWLKRWRAIPSQTTLTPSQRRDNPKNAFRLRSNSNVRERSILLVDDVLTTGSTANEATKILCQAGAKRVCVAVLAHS